MKEKNSIQASVLETGIVPKKRKQKNRKNNQGILNIPYL
jgi:hypothetical protein